MHSFRAASAAVKGRDGRLPPSYNSGGRLHQAFSGCITLQLVQHGLHVGVFVCSEGEIENRSGDSGHPCLTMCAGWTLAHVSPSVKKKKKVFASQKAACIKERFPD
eukprot:527719-Pelagomonas_calceolata.AAC.1